MLGTGLIVTVVEDVDIHPLTSVIVTVKSPFEATVTLGILGF
jgi:hypothetical protein